MALTPEEKKAYHREYYRKNRERLIAQNRARYYAKREEISAQRRQQYRDDPRIKERNARWKSEFGRFALRGITKEIYKTILEAQGGVCAICRRECQRWGRKLVIDHDHDTGKARGLLCNNCNSGIGFFEDRPELLYAAVDYLVKHGRYPRDLEVPE